MKIGIFIAYPPRSELSNQGLGRLLRSIISGISQTEQGSVVLLCPSWLKTDVEQLLHGIPGARLEIVSKKKVPLVVKLWDKFLAKGRKKPKAPGRLSRWKKRILDRISKISRGVGRTVLRLLSSDNDAVVGVSLIALALLAILFSPIALIAVALLATVILLVRANILSKLRRRSTTLQMRAKGYIKRTLNALLQRAVPSIGQVVLREVTHRESLQLVAMANRMKDVDVWFSPTVFWPEFNLINAPRVLSFPDMLISEFPSAFASSIKDAPDIFARAQKTISGGTHFTAYSHYTAEKALIEQFSVPSENVTVIPHASMNLLPLINIKGTMDDAFARDQFARNLIDGFRLTSWQGNEYLATMDLSSTKFIFYPSQLRPNKNIMNLVKGYEIALREKFIYAKLVLTGNPAHVPEVMEYIRKNRLQYDILFAYDVPDQVLAALYSRAALVVNPTLYEGGFPFTFTEGMSVGTPSIMSDIPQVTEYIDGDLADKMLFQPMSPTDIADKIAFGINYRSELCDLQKPLYDKLKNRNWSDVANDYLDTFHKVIEANRR